MHCEICDAIKRLGLDSSAHDLWFCSEHPTWAYSRRPRSNRFLAKRAVWQPEIRHVFSEICRHFPRLHLCPAYRQRIIRLGL